MTNFILKAIGKYIDSSGITKLMTESGLLAEGSVRGLLLGTHFNRCKNLHVVAATAFKILHFNAFWKIYEDESEETNFYLNEIVEILENDNSNPQNNDNTISKLQDFLERYNSFTDETLSGKHGCTAKYIASYIRFIELYQMFEFAFRSSDINLYIYSAHRICALFFALNHQNYARWMTRYLDNLMNIEDTHPGTEMHNNYLIIY